MATAERLYFRRKVAAEMASVSLPLLDRLIREGRISVVRVGRAILIPRGELERLGTLDVHEDGDTRR